MELRVGSPDIEMQRELRTLTLTPTLDATVESTLGELGVRFEEGARLHFEAGGHTLLPVDLDVYTSNHESGEISTSGVSFSDGVRVTLAESAGHVARGLATLRGPSSLRAFDLRKFQAPRRADTAARLSLPTYPHRSIPLTLPDGRALDFTVGTHAPWRISVAAATAEDDE